MIIQIIYERGQMQLDLRKFLEQRNKTKVRKLLKILQSSYEVFTLKGSDWILIDDYEESIKTYINERLLNLEKHLKEYANEYVHFNETVKQGEQIIENLKTMRSRFKKSDHAWSVYNERLKADREKLKEMRARRNKAKRDFNEGQRNKTFLENVLTELI